MRYIKRFVSYLFIFLMPVSISTTSVDSAKTRVQIFGDFGQYALIARGCESIQRKKAIPFKEINIGLQHRFNDHVQAGISVESIGDLKETVHVDEHYNESYTYPSRHYFLVHPTFAFTFGWLSFGGAFSYMSDEIGNGYGFHRGVPGGFLQFGPRLLQFRAQFFYDVPFYLNGLMSAGLNSTLFENFDLFLGLNQGPYDRYGTLFKLAYHFKSGIGIHANVRVGASEGINETAFGMGLSFPLH